jgi:hypothetical protein
VAGILAQRLPNWEEESPDLLSAADEERRY